MIVAVLAVGVAAPAAADVPSSLAAYVRARAASAAGDSRAAAAGYRSALEAAPDDAGIAARAYRQALIAGDMPLARRAAAILQSSGVAPPDNVLIDVGDAIRNRRWAAASGAADRLSGGPLDFLAPGIKAWVAFQTGSYAPDSLPAVGGKNALAARFNAENRALLSIASGQVDQGLAALRTLIGAGTDSVTLRVAAAQLLAGRGERDRAETLLAGSDPVLAAVRERMAGAASPGAAFGVSRLFVRLAGDLVDGEAKPLAILLCRVAIDIEPRDDRARLTLAGALSNDGAQKEALAVLGDVAPSGPYAAVAKAMTITLLSRAGDPKGALAAAERVATRDGSNGDDAQRWGDLLVAAGRFAEGAAAYAAAMQRGGANDWALNLQRGGALEQAGRWGEALPYLRRAVELAPGEAHALNYLGYAQIERGENILAARALLERASALQPDDAAITDSLGWAYVRSGQPAKALPLLERAARAEPGDVTINEHLGDVYWRLGRRYEARYAWRAASVYAEGVEAARIAGKLAAGAAN